MTSARSPGEILREDVFAGLNRPIAELARLLGTSPTTFYTMMNGEQAVTSDMALKIGKLTGTSAEMWMNPHMIYT